MTTFHVKVNKEFLTFAAAHFLTFRGHQCESLHGHNYRVGITVSGPVDPECHFVVDFAVLKQVMQRQLRELDHRVLLAADNPKLRFKTAEDTLTIDYFGVPTYRLPRRDCVLLPVANTTAELLADWFAVGAVSGLHEAGVLIDSIEVEVEESAGQSAIVHRRLAQPHITDGLPAMANDNGDDDANQ